MNYRLFIGAILAVMCLPGIYQTVRASDMTAVIESVPGGTVNWTRGSIQAKGLAPRDNKSDPKGGDRQVDLQAAIDDAHRNMRLAVNGIRMDANHRVGQGIVNDEATLARLEKIVREASVVKQTFGSDGVVAVTVEMSLDGGFAQLVLPDEIKQIDSIRTVSTTEKSSEATNSVGGGSEASPKVTGFTGLVVDARGLELYPTMVPKIYDESGLEVYGSVFASREFAVQYGMIRYGENFEAAVIDPRVAENPLVVKGLRTTQPGHSDIVISNADASKIRASSEHLSFLKKCRVLVVVSAKEMP